MTTDPFSHINPDYEPLLSLLAQNVYDSMLLEIAYAEYRMGYEKSLTGL